MNQCEVQCNFASDSYKSEKNSHTFKIHIEKINTIFLQTLNGSKLSNHNFLMSLYIVFLVVMFI